jgi:hypothetical protein
MLRAVRWLMVAALTLALAPASASASAGQRSTTFSFAAPEETPSLEPRPPVTQRIQAPRAATVTYDDTAGTLAIHISIYDAATWARLPETSVYAGRYCGDDDWDWDIDTTAFYSPDVSSSATLTRAGFDGQSGGTVSRDPDGWDIAFAHPALAGLDLRCVRFATYMNGGIGAVRHFDGFAPFKLTRANATVSFESTLKTRYGDAWEQASRRWALCPTQEFFPHGLGNDGTAAAICMAQFRSGDTWRYVSGLLEYTDDGPVLDRPYTRKWRRAWKRRSASCARRAGVGGVIYSNDGTCPFQMVGDLAYSVERGRTPKYAYWHGTNTAGFTKIARYRCRNGGRTVTCTNAMGDAFRWKR